MANSLQVSRFYTTADGGSAFDEVAIPIEQESVDGWGNLMRFSSMFNSQDVRIFEAPPHAFQDWHNAPRRQLCVMLAGVWEVGTTDGETRRWGPGEAFLPDDVIGKGHTSRVIEGPVRMFFIPLGKVAFLD
ncbi:MAG: hypothetical protein F4W90_02815 [Gammaproteobacteria bacterium]|nr:hypothetical protein [Gammaproteobacteria bacterium]